MLVICNGMLRSGSTLQYNLAAEALEANGPVERVGFIGGVDAPKTRRRLEAMRESESFHILKTHDAPLEPEFYTDRVKLLFTHRDLRDIAASIRKKWGKSFAEIIRDLDAMVAIHKEVEAIDGALVQPYSRLYQVMPEALDDIVAHLGVPLDSNSRTEILRRNALENVTRRLANQRRDPWRRLLGMISGRFRIDPKTKMHTDHVSETGGRDGDWHRVFNRSEVDILTRLQGNWNEETQAESRR